MIPAPDEWFHVTGSHAVFRRCASATSEQKLRVHFLSFVLVIKALTEVGILVTP